MTELDRLKNHNSIRYNSSSQKMTFDFKKLNQILISTRKHFSMDHFLSVFPKLARYYNISLSKIPAVNLDTGHFFYTSLAQCLVF